MKDMYSRLNLACDRVNERYGVEIEVEGELLPKTVKGWKYERDGSLRAESAEYIFAKPLGTFDDLSPVNKAINELKRKFDKRQSVINEAVRAGVHVHINIQDFTPLELMTFVTTYYMLEDYLTNWCGKTRVGNHFCLRSKDAEYVIELLYQACKTKDWRILNTEKIRYTALNLTSMFKYGSVETRCMRSTADLEQVKKFVALVNAIVLGSKKFPNPRNVVEQVSGLGSSEKFIEFVMEELAPEFTQFTELSVYEGMAMVQPIAQLIDWDKFDREKVNPFR